MSTQMTQMTRSIRVGWRRLTLAMMLVLCLPLMLGTNARSTSLHLQGLLATLAEEQPDKLISVIVQKHKTIGDDRIEQQVTQLGGAITNDLSAIKAFTAKLPAGVVKEVARLDGVKWVSLDAPMQSSALMNMTVRDEFKAASFTGSDGTTAWAGNWIEVDPGTGTSGATVGHVRVEGGALRLDDSPDTGDQPSAARRANLAGATAATLSFNYTTSVGVDTTDSVVVEVSNNGGSTYTTLATFTNITGATSGVRSYNIGSYATANTMIRFRVTANYGVSDEFFTVDNVQIAYSANVASFITWANRMGSVVPNEMENTYYIVNRSLGPDEYFGHGRNPEKGAFAGFVAEVTPGHAIAKVEVMLRIWASQPLEDTDDVKITAYNDGVAGASVWLDNTNINQFAGSLPNGMMNHGMVYVDITNTRTWRWGDFDGGLEVVLDHSSLSSADRTSEYIGYDAVGLRITSTPGADNTGGGSPTTMPNGAYNAGGLTNAYNAAVRAPETWNGLGRQGQGLSIAVVDSGIHTTSDLKNRVIAQSNFNTEFHDSADRYGHGTFVASIIAGDGTHSGNQRMGIAPKTNIVNVRVSNDNGMSYESDVVKSLQWILTNKTKHNIRVVNLSLNSRVFQSYHTSPLCAAVELLWFNGIVVVVSSGNNGNGNLYPPANDPFVITVGAVDDAGTPGIADDSIAAFSAYGNTNTVGDKPDLVAPGKNIVAYLPENDKIKISNDHAANRINNDYFRMSGTSMATPMVSGAVALLLQDEPNLNPDQVKYRLKATANKSWAGYNASKAGAGYLDIYAALTGTTTQRANVGIGASNLLKLNGASFTWGSVDWNSVDWNSVDWNSVDWNSVDWNSDYWGN